MNKIDIDGVIGWDIEAKDFNDKLDKMSGDVEIHFNSPGGFITQGTSMLNGIRSYNKGEITAVISFAASMATQMACACDKVEVYDNAIYMIHNAQGIAVGDYREMQSRARVLEAMSNMLSKLYSDYTGKSNEEVRKLMDDETYMFGSEIVDSGFADNIIGASDDKEVALTQEYATDMLSKAEAAIKEEGLNALQLEEQMHLCENGQCNPPPMNVVNAKSGNGNTSTQGTPMSQQDKLTAAESTIETLKAEMGGKDEQITEISAKLDEANTAKESAEKAQADAEAKAELQSTITDLAFEMGVSADVAKEMLAQPTKDKAEILGLKAVKPAARETTSATTEGEDEDTDEPAALSDEVAEAAAAAIAQNL